MRRCLAVVLFLLPAGALADVGDFTPPKPCTLEARASVGYDCIGCDGSAPDGAACGRKLNPEGYQQECRGPGMNAWKEIYCRKHRKVPPAQTTPPVLASAIANVSSSSNLPESSGYNFDPSNLQDADLTTSWQPKKNGKGGKGDWVLVEFKQEVVLAGVGVANGFQVQDRFGDEFALNSRVKTARLVFSDASEETIEFGADQRGLAEFSFAPRKTKWVKLVVEAVHPGSKWKDLAVSELVLFSERARRRAPQGWRRQAEELDVAVLSRRARRPGTGRALARTRRRWRRGTVAIARQGRTPSNISR